MKRLLIVAAVCGLFCVLSASAEAGPLRRVAGRVFGVGKAVASRAIHPFGGRFARGCSGAANRHWPSRTSRKAE